MNSIKTLIAAAVLMLASNVLSGCTPAGVSEVGVNRINEAQNMKKSVMLTLTEVEGKSDVNLQLTLNNPDNRDITSVQAWLSYNPDFLKGVSIDTSDSVFELMAPYDNDFDHEAGLLMLGRSNPSPISEIKALVAEIHFDRVGEGTAMIEAYDYRQDLEGHASANMMFEGVPFNIMLKPETPLLIIETNSNSS